MSTKKVIVIGAGIGGIATAARLAREGYQVTVLEKGSQPGGRVDYFVKEGHHFDTGPTFVLLPHLFRRAFESLGEKLEEHVKLIKVDPNYRLRFDDGLELNLTTDRTEMERQLKAIEPGSVAGFRRFFEEGKLHHDLAEKHFITRQFFNWGAYLNPINLYLLWRVKIWRSHYRDVSRFFKDPRLRAAFTFQDSYLGMSPFDAPALYSLLQYTELAEGIWFPRGGIYSLIRALVNIAEQYGVKFVYDSPVKKINVSGSHASGVALQDGAQIHADIMVANADLPYVYRELLPDDGSWSKLERMKYACSVLMYFWGVDKRFPQFGTHNLFLSGNYRRSFAAVVNKHTMADDPNFYIHAPSRVDSDLAPAGQDSLAVIIPVGHIDDGIPQDWEAFKDRGRDLVFRKLKDAGIDLKPQIKFESCYRPPEWRDKYNLTNGSILGLGHNFLQMGYLRPHNRHKRYKNLYFCGACTHPGSGMPTVLLSANFAADRIIRDTR